MSRCPGTQPSIMVDVKEAAPRRSYFRIRHSHVRTKFSHTSKKSEECHFKFIIMMLDGKLSVLYTVQIGSRNIALRDVTCFLETHTHTRYESESCGRLVGRWSGARGGGAVRRGAQAKAPAAAVGGSCPAGQPRCCSRTVLRCCCYRTWRPRAPPRART